MIITRNTLNIWWPIILGAHMIIVVAATMVFIEKSRSYQATIRAQVEQIEYLKQIDTIQADHIKHLTNDFYIQQEIEALEHETHMDKVGR